MLGAAVLVISLLCLIPINDRSFNEYIHDRATSHKEEFANLLIDAQEITGQEHIPSLFVAIKKIAQERHLDLSKYFSDLNIADVKNLEKKNSIILGAILNETHSKLRKGLDLQGGISFILETSDEIRASKSKEALENLDKAIQIMGKRLDSLGVSEPIIRSHGTNKIEIQLPGLSTQDNPEIVNAIKKPAKLEFRLVHPSLHPKSATDSDVPPGYELLVEEYEDKKTGEMIHVPMYVKRIPEITGKFIKSATPAINQFGSYEIGITMTDEGTKKFSAITKANINRPLAIVLDGKLCSAPVIRNEISEGRASISGSFSQRDAIELANILNNPLEFELKLAEMNEIGPSLAEDARTSSINASIAGISLVVLFMVIYYRISGLIAVVSVLINALITLAVMAMIKSTITLPGIAALVLNIGMGIDANILILERIREELKLGKSIKAALAHGYDRAFSTIFDANLTTLLVALILIWLGTGPVRGFGIILSIGIFATMFCALVLSRAVTEAFIELGWKKLLPKSLFPETNIDFMKYRKWSAIACSLIIIAGLISTAYRGKNIYGIDFSGGDEITVSFEEKIAIQDIEHRAKKMDIGEVGATYQKALGEDCEILKLQTEEGKGEALISSLKAKYPETNLSIIKKDTVGASVSGELRLNALLSVAIALFCIVLYIAFRFEVGFGIGALVSTLYDIMSTIGIYIMFGKQFSSPMIAAILMIIGYSINDTIVVFDRIREELILNPDLSLGDVINLSINKTLSRTILTSLTTFLSALALFCFGAGVVQNIALMFMIGIVTGTFSSIFIASPVLFLWHKGDRQHIDPDEKNKKSGKNEKFII
jgi:SecD/SecF fusion protein